VATKKQSKPIAILTALVFLFSVVVGIVPPVQAAGEDDTPRFDGANRYDTAAKIAAEKLPGASTVIIAKSERGEDTGYPDALAAGVLAGAENAPILLVRDDTLPEETKNAIAGASKAYILGGTDVIKDTVVSEIEALGVTTERIAGDSRVDTAIEIANKANTASDSAFVVGWDNFEDALLAGPYAFNNGTPILIVRDWKDTVDDAVAQAIADLGISNLTIIDTDNSISAELEAALGQLVSGTVERITGANRAETSVNFAEKFFPGATSFQLANNKADALASAIIGDPILYVSEQFVDGETPDTIAGVVDNYLDENAGAGSKIAILGGTAAISSDVENKVDNKLVLKVVEVSAINNNDETVTISGESNGDSITVVITDANNTEVVNESVAVTDGAFSYTSDTLTAADYSYSVTAVRGEETTEAVTGTVTVENVAPTIESVTPIDSTHLQVVFSEKVAKTGAEDVSNYDVRNIAVDANPVDLTAGGGDTAVLGDDGKTVTITIVTPGAVLTEGDYYLVMDQTGTIDTVKDLTGNAVAANASKAFTGIATADTDAPLVTSARYDAASNQLTVYFNEPIKTTSLNKTGFSVTDGTDTVTLTINETATWANGNQRLTFTLIDTTATAVEALTGTKTLSVAEGAVSDNATVANDIAAVSGIELSQATILTAAAYDEATNELTLTFNNAVDVSTLVITEFTLDGSLSTALDANDNVVTTADGTEVKITLADDAGLAAYEGAGVTNRHVDFSAAAGTFVDSEGEAVAATSDVTLTYTEDETKPTLVSAAFNASTSRLTLTFSEKVDISALSATGIKMTGGTGHTLDTSLLENASDASVLTFQHSTDFDTEGGSFVPDETTKIYFNADAFKDLAGNGNAAVTSTNAITIEYADQTPPTTTGVTQEDTKLLKLTFDSKVTAATANVADNYTVVKDDNPAVTINVTAAKLAANQTDVYLTLETDVVNGYGYDVTAVNVADEFGNVIVNDGAGNVENFTANTTTDSTGPALADISTAVVYADVNENYTVDAGDTITLTYTEPVQLSSVAASDFTVTGFTGTSSNNFGTNPTFALGETSDKIVITLGDDPKLQKADLGTATINSAATSNIKDLAGNSATATDLVANDVINAPDTTAPYPTAAVYVDQNADGKVSAGDYLTITFSEALDATVDFSTLADTDFAYTGGNDTVGGGSLTPAFLNSTTLRLTLGTSPDLDGAGTALEYLTSSSTININGSPAELVDLWGNAAAAGTAVDITCEDTTGPYITAAEWIDNNTAGVTQGDYIIVTFSEPVHMPAGGTVDENDFYVSNGGSLGTTGVAAAAGSSANQIMLTLGTSPALSIGNSAINITAAGSADIKDAAGNSAVQYATNATISESATAGDTTAPTITAVAIVNDTTVTVTFSEALDVSTVTTGAFTLSTADGADTETVTNVSLDGTGTIVTVTAGGANIANGDTITVDNTVKDPAGNANATTSAQTL